MPEYPHVFDWIGKHIFSGDKYCDRWMRGTFNYRQINAIIANNTKIPLQRLDELFIASVKQMRINPVVIKSARTLREKHIRTALVTNNMDVFNEITIPEQRLDKTFPVIVNSYDFKMMKQDENGRLFDIALRKLGLSSYEDVLLIDDSVTCCDIFKEKGGEIYHYSNQQAFIEWSEELII
jgi:FMN phosphatase YigB (HAD superfamily)